MLPSEKLLIDTRCYSLHELKLSKHESFSNDWILPLQLKRVVREKCEQLCIRAQKSVIIEIVLCRWWLFVKQVEQSDFLMKERKFFIDNTVEHFQPIHIKNIWQV